MHTNHSRGILNSLLTIRINSDPISPGTAHP